MKKFRKINSIGYGTKVIGIGFVFLLIIPGIIRILSCFHSWSGYVPIMKGSFYLGVAILLLFGIWLGIELTQDRYINRYYEKHKNEKIPLGENHYECQACGNRLVTGEDESCRVCGIKFRSNEQKNRNE
ncbi:hypothetical protein [Anaerosporobacter faecicola]|uniref:hypothetical protein n=1 Tax=Anaerosporobacter faecicola TaxID=2718714 RepID=UPI00143B3560|nr:hypothetical protein [Anaerosporobacter faecicola]